LPHGHGDPLDQVLLEDAGRLEFLVELTAELVEQVVVFVVEQSGLGIEAVDEMVAGHTCLP
jgi:hypothetical protein